MTKLAFIFVFILAWLPAFAIAGQNVGSGGDTITCRSNVQNFLNGTYSLDYILTLQNATTDLDMVQVTSWNQSAERIARVLALKLPALAPYFQEYRQSVFNTDYSRRYIWEIAPFGLMDLKDENIKAQLPENCKSGNEAQIAQAVIRQFGSHSGSQDHVIYKYMPNVVQELERSNPLQLSYLLVHEWLWDFSSNVERNRRFNRLLHSPRFEMMPKEELTDLLRGMGFFLPDIEPDVFQASSCDGRRMSLQEINEKYTSDSVMDSLGAFEITGRRRVLQCSAEDPHCNKTWSPHLGPMLRDNRFFAAISRTWRGDQAPLKIISPDLFRRDGHRVVPGISHLSCQFISHPDANLECSIQFHQVVPELTGEFETTRLDILPKYRGVMTDECIRVESPHLEIIPTFGPAGHSQMTFEYQKIFFLRYHWNR
jgi:hypothetical protein